MDGDISRHPENGEGKGVLQLTHVGCIVGIRCDLGPRIARPGGNRKSLSLEPRKEGRTQGFELNDTERGIVLCRGRDLIAPAELRYVFCEDETNGMRGELIECRLGKEFCLADIGHGVVLCGGSAFGCPPPCGLLRMSRRSQEHSNDCHGGE